MFSELKKEDLIVLDGYQPTQEMKSPPPNVGSCIIKDSGERREFETGAVRDIQEGKGRCDLLPLDVISEYVCRHEKTGNIPSWVFLRVSQFKETGDVKFLYDLINLLTGHMFNNAETMFLEVSKHFEEGAKKYGEYNWQKGIPTHCYIDSAVRHYLKYLRGDTDEPHDRAFVWNILCCIWTCKHKPELNDYDPDRNKVIDALCEVGMVNVVSPEEIEAAINKAHEDRVKANSHEIRC